MKYLTTSEIATIWKISERTVRYYCQSGRIVGTILYGKTWLIPNNAIKPTRKKRKQASSNNLLNVLKREKEAKLKGGIYHKIQIEMTYNSNHIEGSTLTADQTRHIFETKTIGHIDENTKIDDIIGTINHFKCVDLVIDSAKNKLTEALIKQYHFVLKQNTSDASKPWFNVGDYKLIDNEIANQETTPASEVKNEIRKLLSWYNSLEEVTIIDIITFHKRFESIHPFQDGNGRIGRLIMLKECLKHDIVPILILDIHKMYYYRGLKEWESDKSFLIDTCLNGQDIMKKQLDKLKIKYK